MERFFHERIENWDDWSRVYRSIPAFTGLVREIFRREELPFFPLEKLTPGTNGVFKLGDLVVKVFFPKESGLDPVVDFTSETTVCARLAEEGVPTPKLLAKGCLDDKYRFYYIVMEFAPGEEAGDWLRKASRGQKQTFAKELKEILCKLNVPTREEIPPVDLLDRAAKNFRLERLPESLAEEMRARARSLDLREKTLVHGDLTGENLLVNGGGKITVIDCADACIAPAWYEYAPIVFELFRCDPVLLAAFAGGDREVFLRRTLDAVCIHDFGGDLLWETAKRAGVPVFEHLEDVERFLRERMGNCGKEGE